MCVGVHVCRCACVYVDVGTCTSVSKSCVHQGSHAILKRY